MAEGIVDGWLGEELSNEPAQSPLPGTLGEVPALHAEREKQRQETVATPVVPGRAQRVGRHARTLQVAGTLIGQCGRYAFPGTRNNSV